MIHEARARTHEPEASRKTSAADSALPGERGASRFRLALAGLAAVLLLIVATLDVQERWERSAARTDRSAPGLVSPRDRLPLNPFSNARAGDWASYVMAFSEDGKPANRQPVVWRIVGVEGARVFSRLDTRGPGGRLIEGSAREFGKESPPSIESFFRIPDVPFVLDEVELSDDRLAFEGRVLSCKKVSFRCHGADPASLASVVALVSAEVPGSGVASLAIRLAENGRVTRIDYELAGIGDASRTLAGKTVDELATSLGR